MDFMQIYGEVEEASRRHNTFQLQSSTCRRRRVARNKRKSDKWHNADLMKSNIEKLG